MKIWKRAIAVILFLLICGNAMALEGLEDFVDFDTELTDSMDKLTTEWFSTSFNRALLTTCLAVDLQFELGDDFNYYDMLTSTTYVGVSGFDLTVYGRNDDGVIVIIYNPVTNIHKYLTISFENDGGVEFTSRVLKLLSQKCEDYYENDASDMEANLALFVETMSK